MTMYDEKGRKELDLDLSAEPGKPRSKGTADLMRAMMMGTGGPPK